MARLPVVGGDTGNWGTILNDFLEVSLNADGTIQSGALTSAGGVTSVNTVAPNSSGNVTLTPANIGAYAKPSGGIPSSDLSSSVQADLTAASTAVQIGGDIGGTTTAPVITKLQGTAVNAADPASNQVLSYNGSQWVPSTVSSTTVNDATGSSPGIVQLAGDLGGGTAGTATAPQVTSTHLASALPITQGGTGSTTQNFLTLGGDLGNSVTAPTVESIQGVAISGTPSANQALIASSSSAAGWGNIPTASNATSSTPGLIQLDGDLGGSATSPEVMSLKGIVLPSSAPSANQVLTATSGTATEWSTPAAGVTLDTTSSDISPLGTQAAGSIGKAADAGHVHAMPTLNQINAPTASVSLNSQKITGLANGSASTDAAAFGQIPTSASQVGAAQALTPVSVQTYASSPITAAVGQFIPVDTTNGNVVVTLPTSPADGSRIEVKMVKQGSTNTVTVNAGGSNTFNDDSSTSATLKLLNQGIMLQYSATANVWYVQSDDLPLSQLDGRYLTSGSVQIGGDIGGTDADPEVISVLGGRIPLASTSYIDLCTAWNNGSGTIATVAPATALTVTFTSSSTTATVTTGTAPASGALFSDALPAGTTYTASGSTLTLSSAATSGGSYPAWAGQDATSALQSAVNYFSANNIDGTVEFSRPGIYLLNGAQQTGSAQGYSYSGQILFPARALASGMISVRVRGSSPIAGFAEPAASNPAGGVVLLSAATSGCIFDAIPSYMASTAAQTFLSVTFENVVIRAHANPQLTAAVNGTVLAGMRFFDTVHIDTTAPGGSASSALTGSGYGAIFPVIFNMGENHQTGDAAITGYPTGLSYGEHFVAENILIQGCVNGIYPNDVSEGHSCKIQRCCVQGVVSVINANNNYGRVSGFFDIGDPGGVSTTLEYVVNDSQNRLYGTVEVAVVEYSGGDDVQRGFPVNGGLNLKLVPYTGRGGELPYDTFTRLLYTSAAAAGVTDSTFHVWTPIGSNSPLQVLAANQCTGLSSGSTTGIVKYNGGRASMSRTVRTVTALRASNYAMWHIIGNVISGANYNANGNYLNITVQSGVIKIIKQIGGTQYQLAATATGTASGTVSGTSVTGWAGTITPVVGMTVTGGGFTSGSVITGGITGSSGSWGFTVSSSGTSGSQSLTLGFAAGSLTYTMDTVISNPLSAGGAWTVTVMVNGYQALTYTLTASDTGGNSISQLADSEQRYTQDGFGFYGDSGTVISEFAVLPN
jgi:hypothetical protein